MTGFCFFYQTALPIFFSRHQRINDRPLKGATFTAATQAAQSTVVPLSFHPNKSTDLKGFPTCFTNIGIRIPRCPGRRRGVNGIPVRKPSNIFHLLSGETVPTFHQTRNAKEKYRCRCADEIVIFAIDDPSNDTVTISRFRSVIGSAFARVTFITNQVV